MYIKRHRINLTVTASGGASHTFLSDYIANGALVEAIHYAPATASGISTAAGLAITGVISGLTILACTATGEVTHYPRAYAENVSGAALGYSSAATPPGIPVRIPVAQEKIKVVVTSGGAASGSVGGLKGMLDLYLTGV